MEFDSFLNSFRVEEKSEEKLEELHLVAFIDISHAKPYELKVANGKNYIISDSRDLHKHIKI